MNFFKIIFTIKYYINKLWVYNIYFKPINLAIILKIKKKKQINDLLINISIP